MSRLNRGYLLDLGPLSWLCRTLQVPKHTLWANQPRIQMAIDNFTSEELLIPANTENGDGSPRILPMLCPPTFKERIVVIGDDIEADLVEELWSWGFEGYWVSAWCARCFFFLIIYLSPCSENR